jgi:hypothetical protein
VQRACERRRSGDLVVGLVESGSGECRVDAETLAEAGNDAGALFFVDDAEADAKLETTRGVLVNRCLSFSRVTS